MNIDEYIGRYQRAFQNIYRNVNNMIKEHVHEDITTDQFQIMQYIYNSKTVTATEIAQSFGVGKSAITAIVNRLTDKALIERERNEDDRRVVYLRLTETGRSIVKETEEKIHDYIYSMLGHFDPKHIEQFIYDLEKLSHIMDENKGDLR